MCVKDYHFHSKHVVVKFNEDEKMHHFFKNYRPTLIFDKGEIPFALLVLIAGNKRKNVKIKFIPNEIEVEELKNTRSKFGTIESIKWEEPIKFNEDIYEVKRERVNVAMLVNKHIPSFITITGIILNVTFQGQPRSCLKCDEPSHETRNCMAKPTYASSVRKHMRNGDRKLNFEEGDVLNLRKAIKNISNFDSNEEITKLKESKPAPITNGKRQRSNKEIEQTFPIIQDIIKNPLVKKASSSAKLQKSKNNKKNIERIQ